jgi:hypothetical protein
LVRPLVDKNKKMDLENYIRDIQGFQRRNFVQRHHPFNIDANARKEWQILVKQQQEKSIR